MLEPPPREDIAGAPGDRTVALRPDGQGTQQEPGPRSAAQGSGPGPTGGAGEPSGACPSFVHRVELTTADPAVARDHLHRLYGARMSLVRSPPRGPILALAEARTAWFRSAELVLTPATELSVRGTGELVVIALAEGEIEIEEDGRRELHRAGEVFLGNWPGAHFRGRTNSVRALVVAIRLEFLGSLTESVPQAGAGLRFASRAPVDPDAGTRWMNTARHLHQMLRDPQLSLNPLVIGAVGRLLAATTLATFPNETPARARSIDSADLNSVTLSRAIAFIESWADTDITLPDIAAATNVSVRAVQLAFRRHLNSTPTTYLRTVRLTRAHQDLIATRPEAGDTVASIAARWGFTNPGRFAALYRSTYGIPPRRALHR